MSKIINKIMFGFCLLSLVLFASTASGITNVLPQIQAVYGGSIKTIDVIEPAGTISNVRIFVSTDFSANSIFYADVNHALDTNKFSTNNFRFRVIPDFNAQANFGTVGGIAGHEDSGRLFVADNYGLLSCTTNAGSLVTNIASSGNPGAQFLAVSIHESTLVALAFATMNMSNVLYFGTLDSAGTFTQDLGSPINIGLSGIVNSSGIGLAVNPSNSYVYVIDSGGTNGIFKSSAPCTSLSGATFSKIALPSQASLWSGKHLGFGPEGRMFVGAATETNSKVIAYSDNDGTDWNVVHTGVGGGGNNIRTSYQTNLYGVLFGSAVSTNKGETGSWSSIGYGAGPNSAHANDSDAFYDPVLDRRSFYCSSDQGMGCSTNGGQAIFEIDYGLEAVVIQDLDMTADKTLAWTASKSGLRRGSGTPMALVWTPDGMFPCNDGAPYRSIAIDKGDTSGNTVYAGNCRIYKSTDGGTGTWNTIWTIDGNTNGFSGMGYFATLAANGQTVVAGFYSLTGAGGLLVSQNGGSDSNWAHVISSMDVNDVLLMTNGNILVAAAYSAASGVGGIYNQSTSGRVHEMSENVSIRCFAPDSAGGVYACGQASDYALKIYYKSLSDSSWTAVTTNGLLLQNAQMVGERGPVMTIGRDSSSNDLPIIIVEHSLYYLESGASTWQTSSALTYPDGSVINVLYWDELMVGTSEGIYSQDLGLRPVTITLADPVIVDIAGNWYVWFSGSGYQRGGPWSFGGSGLPVTGDFDGDHYADPALVDEDTGAWSVWFSSLGYQMGGPYSLGILGSPVAADFDGDHYADPAVEDLGDWYIWYTSLGYRRGGPYSLGVFGTPVAADFDGDHYADPAIVDGANDWCVWFTSLGYRMGGPYSLGVAGTPVAGDFDGDGYADPAMVDSTGAWRVWYTSLGYQMGGPYSLGVSGTPLAADFDGR